MLPFAGISPNARWKMGQIFGQYSLMGWFLDLMIFGCFLLFLDVFCICVVQFRGLVYSLVWRGAFVVVC